MKHLIRLSDILRIKKHGIKVPDAAKGLTVSKLEQSLKFAK